MAIKARAINTQDHGSVIDIAFGQSSIVVGKQQAIELRNQLDKAIEDCVDFDLTNKRLGGNDE